MAAADQRLRCYLTGRVAVEGATTLDQRAFPGRQGRLAFVRLVLDRHSPVPTTALAESIWGAAPPPSWETSLRAIVSKLRRALARVAPAAHLISDGGCYQAMLGDVWVDVEAAANAIDRAEGAWRRRHVTDAWSDATVAASIAARPFLAGEDLPWVVDERRRLQGTWIRALDVLAHVHADRGDQTLAVLTARRLIELDPYRESAYRHLMRAHLAAGDRGQALRAYAELERRLGDELGVDPAPETAALHIEALRSGV